jgi:hypothetical protein
MPLSLDQPPDENDEQNDHQKADQAITGTSKSEGNCGGEHENSLIERT